MNELQALRKLRERASSSDESLSALRHDLLRETRTPRRGFRVPRPAWRLAVAGALAVGLLGAATIVQRGTEPTSPAGFLERAAAAVESQESGQVERPRNNQWMYQKVLWDTRRWPGWMPSYLPAGAPGEVEDWIRFDGKGWWEGRDGKPTDTKEKLKPDFVVPGNPAQTWDAWQTLPRDPQALLDLAYEQADTKKGAALLDLDYWAPPTRAIGRLPERDQAAMDAISQVLAMGRGLTAPKDLQASLYRALALIPDIKIIKGVKDVGGRDAIAVTYTSRSQMTIFLLDPVTYDYLGWGTQLDHSKVTGGVALLEAKVVDKPGER